jgi:hypothetical protein
MEKVIPLIKFSKTIFYFKFSELGKTLFWSESSSKLNLNAFESFYPV